MASYIPPLETKTILPKTGRGMNGKGMGKGGCQINVYQINGRAEDAERKREFVRGMLVRGMGRGLRRFAPAERVAVDGFKPPFLQTKKFVTHPNCCSK